MNMHYKTQIASLESYEKGSIELNDDLKHYAFSNIFEVANNAAPFERVQVVSNMEYSAEVVKSEGTSSWYTAPHDEFAIVMDGEIEFTFYKLEEDEKPDHKAGATKLGAEPKGKRMGLVRARRGHEVLLPAGSTYQLKSSAPAVMLLQTLAGPETVEKWSEICTLN
ncbi:hydroxyquinol 1,2-dioxygenase [Gammaproteobacteria bacterium]|nr:hydroxyquinol 1,2-dioxygenase [Gammaproteobacteria bacterium]